MRPPAPAGGRVKREHPAAARRRAEEEQAVATDLQAAVRAMRTGRFTPRATAPAPNERPPQS